VVAIVERMQVLAAPSVRGALPHLVPSSRRSTIVRCLARAAAGRRIVQAPAVHQNIRISRDRPPIFDLSPAPDARRRQRRQAPAKAHALSRNTDLRGDPINFSRRCMQSGMPPAGCNTMLGQETRCGLREEGGACHGRVYRGRDGAATARGCRSRRQGGRFRTRLGDPGGACERNLRTCDRDRRHRPRCRPEAGGYDLWELRHKASSIDIRITTTRRAGLALLSYALMGVALG